MSKEKIQKVPLSIGRRILDPEEVPASSSNDLHPAFCFKFCCTKGFTIKDCDKDSKVLLMDKVDQLSNINWGTIQKSPRHGLGHEIIYQDAIEAPLPPNTPGDRKFLAFRLGGGKNSVLIGYRERKIFYVVWVDRKGAVYKHS